MKTSKKDYDNFVKYCRRYINMFGLQGWNIYFSHEGCDEDHYADTTISYTITTAHIKLNKDFGNEIITQSLLKECALHEVLHIVLGEMSGLMRNRYITEEQVMQAEERAVNTLVSVLNPVSP